MPTNIEETGCNYYSLLISYKPYFRNVNNLYGSEVLIRKSG